MKNLTNRVQKAIDNNIRKDNSYIYRLIDRATTIDSKLKKNKLGTYSISTNKYTNVTVYCIYKQGKQISSISIYDDENIDIEITKNIKGQDIVNTVSSIISKYPDRIIKTIEKA